VKLLTDLQILCCELHKNAFGSRALPGPAGGAISLSRARWGSYGAIKGMGEREGEGKGWKCGGEKG